MAAAGLLVAGCGGDDEQEETAPPAVTTPVETPPTTPVTQPPAETAPMPGRPDREPGPREPPPEEQQGDEEPIRSEAVFTGRGGTIAPREVRVPAFIAIRVILRSADGRSYSLRIAGRQLRVGADRRADEAPLDGLLPDESYAGRGPQGRVRVVASAEPGP